MANNNEDITTKYNLDISGFKKGISEANQLIKLANAEFKSASAGMDDWSKSAEGIQAKLKQLGTLIEQETNKLNNYKEQQEAMNKAYQENGKRANELKEKLSQLASQGIAKTSDEYKKYQKVLDDVEKEQEANKKAAESMAITILNQQGTVNKLKKDYANYETTLKNVDDAQKEIADSSKEATKGLKEVGNEAEKTESKAGKLAKSLAGTLAKGLVGLTTVAVAGVGTFLGLGEATQDTIEDMGKLETAFVSAGHSAETGQKSFQEMVGILGETDRAVEAVNHLAKLTKSEEELSKWTDIATGIYATFGDSLPIEGLTEAVNETAKVGQVTGPLADALNWAGISEDKFNESLQKCNSEQERATLITETLNDLYSEASSKYKEVNGDLIKAREATAKMSTTTAELGRVAMPIVTALKNGVVDFLNVLLPGVQQVGKGITGLMNNTSGASEQLRAGLDSIINGIIGKITEFLPEILNFGIQIITSLIQGILNALPSVITTIVNIIPQITQAILNLLPQLVTIGVQLIQSILIGLGKMLPQIVLQIVNIIPTIIQALVDGIPALINGAVQFFMGIVQAIPQIISALLEAIPQIINSLVQALIEGLPLLIDGAIQLFMGIINAIPQILPILIDNIPLIINTLITGLIQGLDAIIDGAVQLLMGIIEAIPIIIKYLIPMIPTIIQNIVKTLIENLPVLLEGAVQLFMALVEAIPIIVIELVKALPQIVDAIINTLAKPIQDIFGEAWNGLVNGAKGAWEGIKSIFSKVTNFFKDIFGKAWNAVKNIFSTGGKIFDGIKEGITNAFKTIVNGIIKGINKVVAIPFNAINQALRTLRNIKILEFKPFSWIKEISVPQIPELEYGGILKKGQTGYLEGKGDEAVVPLHKNKYWIRNVARELKGQLQNIVGNPNSYTNNSNNSKVINYTQNNYSPKPLSRIEIYRQSKNLLALTGGV